jgi:hypothetical protein
MEGIAELISQFGFPIVAMVAIAYFIYFIWTFINEHLGPALNEMQIALVRVIDKTRMLDQDMIRLQQKVNVVLEYREAQKIFRETLKDKELEELNKKVNEIK